MRIIFPNFVRDDLLFKFIITQNCLALEARALDPILCNTLSLALALVLHFIYFLFSVLFDLEIYLYIIYIVYIILWFIDIDVVRNSMQ